MQRRRPWWAYSREPSPRLCPQPSQAATASPVIQAMLQLREEELGVELVDGGDVGENEPDHVLGEGLAAASLPQQLLEKHLRPPAGHLLGVPGSAHPETHTAHTQGPDSTPGGRWGQERGSRHPPGPAGAGGPRRPAPSPAAPGQPSSPAPAGERGPHIPTLRLSPERGWLPLAAAWELGTTVVPAGGTLRRGCARPPAVPAQVPGRRAE